VVGIEHLLVVYPDDWSMHDKARERFGSGTSIEILMSIPSVWLLYWPSNEAEKSSFEV